MDPEKLNRFFNGKSKPSEAREIIEWIYSEGFEEEYSEMLQTAISSRQSPVEWSAVEELRKLKDKIPFGEAAAKETRLFPEYQTRKNSWAVFARIAAIIALAAVSTFALFTIKPRPEPTVEKQAAMIVKSTSKGQKSTIFLPDGSRVGLNSNSSIAYPEFFTGGRRTVEMTGEAFFEVKSDTANPFIVKTGAVTATAVGTAFNVNAMDEESVIVSLIDGRLAVKSGDDDLLLDPGQQAVYQTQTSDFIKRKFDPEAATGWKDGILIFVNEKFDDVIEKLELWYGVEFHIVNRPAKLKHYTGKFINESLDNVLEGIGFTNNFSYVINGKNVTIRFLN